MDKAVLILGQGAMGQVFSRLLEGRCRISVWDRDPQSGTETRPLEELAPGHGLAILAVPTQPHGELAERLGRSMDAGAGCVSIAKGLDAQGRTPARILDQACAQRLRWGTIYGPMIAREIQQGRSGFADFASREASLRTEMAELFRDSGLYLRMSTDVHGTAWAAILKNVYVPLIGAADALELGDNLRGFLMAEILAELAAIVERLGGSPRTPFGLAGLGDLVTTATSPSSHHRRIGEDLARGETGQLMAEGAHIRTEGVHTVQRVLEHRPFPPEDFPLFELVVAFLREPADLATRLDGFLRERFAGTEMAHASRHESPRHESRRHESP